MKKKIIIIAVAIFSFFVVCFLGSLLFYFHSLKAVGDSSDRVTFIIENGTSSKEIVDSLYSSGLIKNQYTGYIYLKLHGDFILQAGVYDLNKGMDFPTIMDSLSSGKVIDNSISVTFVEGKRLTTYVKQISDTFSISEEEILRQLSDTAYLQTLIEKYWFLTDEILNDKLYYALEGYLYPNTYRFKEDATLEEILEKMLDATGAVLSPYKDAIEKSDYSVHEILAMASIIELEAVTKEDRATVSQVIHKRLDMGMTLGMDVTTYYAVQKDMSEELWEKDLKTNNPFNTRVVTGLPVGPICNSGVDSVNAVFHPTETNYVYFYADVRTGKVYFAETYDEFMELIKQYGV